VSTHLPDLGVYGFDRYEPVILAALVTEDPPLLIGRSGTGKTFLLNSLSEALGLPHRHYNASLVAFDDLVGFPYPDDGKQGVRFLETPATVRGAESVLIGENPFAIRAVLRILAVAFTEDVPTLAVTREPQPRLPVNLGFLAAHAATEEQAEAVVCHEFLHVLVTRDGSPRLIEEAGLPCTRLEQVPA
jgi:hypothetical protein